MVGLDLTLKLPHARIQHAHHPLQGFEPDKDRVAPRLWKGTDTLQRRYMKPDEHTMRAMFDKRVPLRSARSS